MSDSQTHFDAVLVRDQAELDALGNLHPQTLDRLEIYTLLPKFFTDLTLAGIHPRIFSQYISAPEAYEIYLRAFREITRAVGSLADTEPQLPVHLPRFFKVFYVEFLIDVIAIDMALRNIRDERPNRRLAYFRRKCPQPDRHTALADPTWISQHILDVLRKESPDSFVALDVNIPIARGPARAALESARNVFRRTRTSAVAAVRKSATILTPSTSPPTGPRSIAFGSGYDALIVIPDALTHAAEAGLEPLWMTEAVDTATLRSGLVHRPEFDRVERFSIRSFLDAHPVQPLPAPKARIADAVFAAFLDRLNVIDPIRQYGFTKELTRLGHEFKLALQRSREIDSVLAKFPDSTVFLTDYNGLDERAIEQLAPKHKITRAVRPHGWIANVEGYEFQADRHLLSGSIWARVLTDFYGADLPIELSPDPSLTRVADDWLRANPAEQKARVASLRADLGIDAPHVVLFMTTAARKHILNEFDYRSLQILWDAVFDFLLQNPDCHLCIKSHKNNFDHWVQHHADTRGVKNLSVLSGRLEHAVILADLIVDLGKPGSATLVALIFRKPTLLYSGLYKYVRQMGDLTYHAAGPSLIREPQHLIAEFDRLRIHSHDYLADLARRNESLRRKLSTDSPQCT